MVKVPSLELLDAEPFPFMQAGYGCRPVYIWVESEC